MARDEVKKPDPGWLLAEIRRARARREQVPVWARPVLVRRSR